MICSFVLGSIVVAVMLSMVPSGDSQAPGTPQGPPPPIDSGTPKSSSARAASDNGQAMEELAHCLYDCGPPMPPDKFVTGLNICKPCHAAQRSIIRTWAQDASTKAMLAKVRKEEPSRWFAMVRNCRIRSSPEELGVDSTLARKWWICESKTRFVQYVGINNESEIKWLSERRYIAHQVFVEGIQGATLLEKETNALLKWAEDIKRTEATRTGPDGQIELATHGVSRAVGFRGRQFVKEVEARGVNNAKDLDAAMQSVAGVGTNAHALTSAAMGDFGEVFAPGHASAANPNTQLDLPGCSSAAAPSNVVAEASSFEPTRGFTGAEAPKRKLQRNKSDPAKRTKGGVTEEVLFSKQRAWIKSKKRC